MTKRSLDLLAVVLTAIGAVAVVVAALWPVPARAQVPVSYNAQKWSNDSLSTAQLHRQGSDTSVAPESAWERECASTEKAPPCFLITSFIEPLIVTVLTLSLGLCLRAARRWKKCTRKSGGSSSTSTVSVAATTSRLVGKVRQVVATRRSKARRMPNDSGSDSWIHGNERLHPMGFWLGLQQILSVIDKTWNFATRLPGLLSNALAPLKNSALSSQIILIEWLKSTQRGLIWFVARLTKSVLALAVESSTFFEMASWSQRISRCSAAPAILACLLATSVSVSKANENTRTVTSSGIPQKAAALLPKLRQQQQAIWPDAPIPSFLAAQIEQETCISLRHVKCWDPTAELKTSREYGFGLLQATVAYRPDGSVRFNKWAELRTRYPSLRGWTWENRFDPGFQLTALVEMDKSIYKLWPDAASARDRLGFTLSAYNGGEGGVRQDRLLCRNTSGCDPTRWFGHVEHHSLKSRVAFKGYRLSPFEINREYPHNVLGLRRPKYEPFFRE